MAMSWRKLLNHERPRPTTSTGDHRAQFERDFDRAVFSTPVKRMQDKAQVFPLEPNDAIRTRLTHSLEVSSVARGLATAIAQWLMAKKEIESGMDRSIEAIAATCGLIHDLGNPPFGHAGEDAIRGWFEKRLGQSSLKERLENRSQLINDFLKFEGNAQSLRLIARLQVLADFHGLNMTYGTLSASCKYIAASHEADSSSQNHAMTKPGYFASENSLVAEIRAKTDTGTKRNPITFWVEAADDIVYSVADIEDGVKKGILSWNAIQQEISKDGDPVIQRAILGMHRILRTDGDKSNHELPDDVFASAFRTSVIGIVVSSVSAEFQKRYSEIMDGTYTGELVKDCDANSLVQSLKNIGQRRIYCTPANLKLELMGRKVIYDLLEIFWEGAEYLPIDGPVKTKRFSGKVAALLSENYRRVFRHFMEANRDLPETYHRFQLLTDYICGMTDSFAKRLHTELMNG